jgi:ABC-type nitrate/sulfonate/bicarbonate transport system substrate-binding protein
LRVFFSSAGSSSDIATRAVLRKVGVDAAGDVTIVPVGSLENRMAALSNGAIQGGQRLAIGRSAVSFNSRPGERSYLADG